MTIREDSASSRTRYSGKPSRGWPPGPARAQVSDHHPVPRARSPSLGACGYTRLEIDQLDREAARQLLRRHGVRGDDRALDLVIKEYGSHALTLDHVGAYLAEFCRRQTRRGRPAERTPARLLQTRGAEARPRPPPLRESSHPARARSPGPVLPLPHGYDPGSAVFRVLTIRRTGTSVATWPAATRPSSGESSRGSRGCTSCYPSRAEVTRPTRPSATTSTRPSRTPRWRTRVIGETLKVASGLDLAEEWERINLEKNHLIGQQQAFQQACDRSGFRNWHLQ